MNKKFMIPSVIPAGSEYKPSETEVAVFDEWSKLGKEEQDVLSNLMNHYLQKRWDEQYKKLINNKEEKTIGLAFVKLLALEDLKKDINYKLFHNNLGTLSKNISQAHARLKEKQIKEQASSQEVHQLKSLKM